MLAASIAQLLRRQLVSNALSLYAVQGLNYLVPLLLLPYLLRTLGPNAFGVIVLAQALMGYAIIATEFGFNFTAARDVSVARRDPDRVARVYWTTMAAKSLLLVVSLIVVLVVVVATPALRSHLWTYVACSLLVFGNVAFPQWYFQGLERLKEMALAQAIAKILIAVATVAFVRSPSDLLVAAALSSAPQLLGVVVAIALGRPVAPSVFYRPRTADVADALRQSWHMFAASISTTLYLNTNAFVLGLLSGPAAVAEYGLANRLVLVLQGIATPVTQAVFPRASLLFAERREQAWALMARVAKLVLPAVGVASLLLALFAPQVIALVGGPSYAGAASVVRIMSANPVLIAVAALPAQIIMVNTGLTRQLLQIYLVVGLLNLVLLPILVTLFSANGAALSLTLAESLSCCLMATTIWRHRKRLGLSLGVPA
jgi:O-antigen/teichoic acid export membrane protein